MARVTLADVSREAGVGIATASRALSTREHPDINSETRQRIRAVADELGYRPSVAARAFRRRDFHAVSIVVPDGRWGWWEPVIRAAFGAARERGYTVLVQPTTAMGEDSGDVADVIEAQANVPTEGVLLFGAAGDSRMLASAEALRLPVVAIDNTADEVAVPTFGVDSRRGVELAVRHLLDLGRTKVAYVGSDKDLLFHRIRLDGYRSALAAAGITVDPRLIVRSPRAFGPAIDRVPEFESLLASDAAVDAVLCETDDVAAPVLRSLRRAGLRVPDDVSVVGFDDSRLAGALDPPLTTVRQPYEELGRRAVELLLGQIAGDRAPVGRTLLPPTLTMRASSQLTFRDIASTLEAN